MLINHFPPNPCRHTFWGIWIKEGKDQTLITNYKSACKEVLAGSLYRVYISKVIGGLILDCDPSKLTSVNVCSVFVGISKLDMQKIGRNTRLLLNTFENLAGIPKSKVAVTKTNRKDEEVLMVQSDLKWATNLLSLSLLVNLIALANSVTQRKKDLSVITVTTEAIVANPLSGKSHTVLLEYFSYYAKNFDKLFSKEAKPKTYTLDSSAGIVSYTENRLGKRNNLEKTCVRYKYN